MKIPDGHSLYYISDLQIKRLKLVNASIAGEIMNQQFISDEEEARISREITEEDTRHDHELDQQSAVNDYDDVPDDSIPDNWNSHTRFNGPRATSGDCIVTESQRAMPEM